MRNLFFKFKNGAVNYDGQLKYEDDEYIIVAEGDIRLFDANITLIQVAEHLRKNKDIADIDGLYSMIVFNKQTLKIYALQDIFSYFHPLYYSVDDGGICIALLLRQVIVENKMVARLEKNNIDEFLYNGFLTDDRCLISQINKVPAMHVMVYDVIQHKVSYIKRFYSIQAKSEDDSDYYKIIEKNLQEILDGRTEINMALSSGFDSNFLLDSINRINPKCKINAYTIGAANGNDETEKVKKICSFHPEINLTIGQVTPDILQALPQMIYELEDSVFERGIFLQYVISSVLSQNSLLLGEGADQILSSEFKTSADHYYFVGIEQHYPWVYYPYEMLTYIILKKNGIFLRNRDIKAYYPFLKGNFIRGVSALRKLNGTSKEHYKAYVAERTGKEVGAVLNKRPGSTNLSTLFNNDNQQILSIAKTSEFYQYLPKQPDRDSGNEVDIDNCLKILFLMVFEELFCNKGIEDLKSDKIDSSLDEILSSIISRKGGSN